MMRLRLASGLGLTIVVLALAGCGSSSDGGGGFSQQVREAERITDPGTRATKLINLANQQHQAEDRAGAASTLSLAHKACAAVEDPATKATRFAWLAMGYTYCDHPSGAAEALKQCRAALKAVSLEQPSDYSKKVASMTQVARAQHTAGETSRALLLLRDAETLTMEMKFPNMKSAAQQDLLRRAQVENLATIVSIHKAIDKINPGRRVAGEALKLAQQIANTRDRADMIATVAEVQSQLKMDEADATFALAEQAADEVEDPHLQGHALVFIAAKLLRCGRRDKAIKLLDQAEQLALKVQDNAFQKELQAKIRKTRP